MKKNVFFLVGLLVIIMLNAFAFEQKNQTEKSFFNVEFANKTFDSIEKTLATRSDYTTLTQYTQQLDELQTDAKKCVSNADSNLKIINELLKSTAADRVTRLQQADYQYLQGKELHYAKQLSDCRLFIYRSQEALTGYKDTLQKLSAYQILKRGTPIWKVRDNEWVKSIDNIDYDKMMVLTGYSSLVRAQWITGFVFLVLSVIVAFYTRSVFKRWLRSAESAHHLWRALLLVTSQIVAPVIILSLFVAFFLSVFESATVMPSLELISMGAIVLTLSIALAKYLFYPSSTLLGLFSLPIELGNQFFKRILFLLLGLFFGFVAVVVFREQAFEPAFIELIRTIYITILSLVAVSIILLWHHFPVDSRSRHSAFLFMSTLLLMATIFLMIAEWLGYHRFVVFSMLALCLTVVYTIAAFIAWRLIELFYQWMDNKQYAVARKVHQVFGVKLTKKIHEFFLIKITVHFAVLCFYIIALLKSWSVSANFIDTLIDSLLYGFKFLGMTIIPLRIALSLLSFSVILLAGRFIAASVAKKQHFKGEEDTQIAISTITIYVSFAVALLFALLMTGVDFTGLAIVAGALSVGVGLGLQNIVNNFVSGLILLIEKPIKPGDRIVIGKTEGFVRKIRIRSTQIATLAKEDVIVPNADFITQQVTNYMFRDRNARVSCQVGVAYGSDVDLVKKLLLEVAAKHDDVVHESPNEPVVLFSRFGDSSLIFDLWCIIHDVNKKNFVMSDLNFAIDAAFREHNITIPFPQRELHIKEADIFKPKE